MTSQVYPTSASQRVVVLAIGGNQPSNKGNPAKTVAWAIQILSDRVGSPIRKSRLFLTPAFPAGAGPDYVNAAISFLSPTSASEVLDMCHAVEADAARTRVVRWGQRTLDIDLVACGDEVAPDHATYRVWRDLPLDRQIQSAPDQLILPHPRLQDRSFVLVPMMDVAPDWVHPVSGLTTAQMLAARPDAEKASIVPLEKP